MRRILPVLSLLVTLLLVGCSPDPDEEPPADTSEPTQTDTGANDDTSADSGGEESSDATDTTPGEDAGSDADDTDAAESNAPTYHADVKPIVDGRCVKCHTEGGIGPFPLTSYDEVESLKGLVKNVVGQKTMPPYLAADGCRKYKHDSSLTDQQIETVTRWVDAGAPEGDPANAGEPLPEVKDGLSRVDETLALPTEKAVKLALRTQQILAHETSVTQTVDPLAGSYFMERLTDDIEPAAFRSSGMARIRSL